MIRRILTRWLLSMLPASFVVPLPEDRVQAALDRGYRAKALLNDETLSAAFGEIETRLKDGWSNSATVSKEAREAMFYQVAALQSVRSQLQSWSDDALLIAARLEKRR